MNSSTAHPPCPICKLPAAPRTRWAPFCSSRCQLIDLGNWLGESYRVPGPPEDPEDSPPDPRDREDGADG